jgi:hypothetical protein
MWVHLERDKRRLRGDGDASSPEVRYDPMSPEEADRGS